MSAVQCSLRPRSEGTPLRADETSAVHGPSSAVPGQPPIFSTGLIVAPLRESAMAALIASKG